MRPARSSRCACYGFALYAPTPPTCLCVVYVSRVALHAAPCNHLFKCDAGHCWLRVLHVRAMHSATATHSTLKCHVASVLYIYKIIIIIAARPYGALIILERKVTEHYDIPQWYFLLIGAPCRAERSLVLCCSYIRNNDNFMEYDKMRIATPLACPRHLFFLPPLHASPVTTTAEKHHGATIPVPHDPLSATTTTLTRARLRLRSNSREQNKKILYMFTFDGRRCDNPLHSTSKEACTLPYLATGPNTLPPG